MAGVQGISVAASRMAPAPFPSAERRRDRVIESDIVDAVSAHRELENVGDVRLWVDGGVAHLRGTVDSARAQRLLRKVIGRVKGVYAVWDLLERENTAPLRVLDVGCGGYKQAAEAIGVDRFLQPPVEVLTDLEQGLPFSSESIDHIFAVHVLEHVSNLVALMNDIHRVLKTDGTLHVMVPYWQHEVAVADPTHVRFFAAQSFKVFCRRTTTVNPFLPLAISHNRDTVFADLTPDKEGEGAIDDDIVRFFL